MKITRRQAREITLCLVFNYGFNTDRDPKELLEASLSSFPEECEQAIKIGTPVDPSAADDPYISRVYFGVAENLAALDEIIRKNSLKWKFERISRIAVSILRVAVYELLYMDDIPREVTINEAVELSKKYDTEESFTFVNGILGTVVRNMPRGSETDPLDAAGGNAAAEAESGTEETAP